MFVKQINGLDERQHTLTDSNKGYSMDSNYPKLSIPAGGYLCLCSKFGMNVAKRTCSILCPGGLQAAQGLVDLSIHSVPRYRHSGIRLEPERLGASYGL